MINIKQTITYAYITFGILLATTTSTLQIKKVAQPKQVTIFVHGTIFPFLALLNGHKTYTHTLKSDDWYAKCISKLRTNPLLQEDSLMLDSGLQKIDTTILQHYIQQTLPVAWSKKGAYQAIGAYHTFTKFLETSQTHSLGNDYYTFGFNGLLSESHRKQAGHDLYASLVELIYTYRQQNYEPLITLCGYSHGGNVILYTAEAAQKFPAQITIDTTVLLGTPLQAETAQLVQHDIFRTVLNIYSEADAVQNGDTISTPQGITHRTLSDFFNIASCIEKNPNKHIYDLQLAAHDNTQAFGHYAYWFFNHYTSGLFTLNDYQTQAIINTLTPLPLVILVPVIIDLIKRAQIHTSTTTSLILSLRQHDSYYGLHLINPADRTSLLESPNLKNILSTVQHYAQTSWQPYVHEGHIMRIALGLLTAFQTIAS